MDGVRLMAVGMTTVFVFLGGLVVAMQVSAAAVARFGPDEPTPGDAGGPVAGDSEIAVVLAALAARIGRA